MRGTGYDVDRLGRQALLGLLRAELKRILAGKADFLDAGFSQPAEVILTPPCILH